MSIKESYVLEKSVIFVLGSGRSGTSMMTELLSKIGLELSKNLIPAGIHNQRGFFEDRDIININNEILMELGNSLLAPLNFIENINNLKKQQKEVKKILRSKIQDCCNTLVIKDPRISSTLPLWQVAATDLKLNQYYILMLRHPSDSVNSMIKSGIDKNIAEILWLKRNLDSIIFTKGECCIIHYEDCLKNYNIILCELNNYLDFSKVADAQKMESSANLVIDNTLKHFIEKERVSENQITIDFYNQLCSANKGQSSARVLEVARQTDAKFRDFSNWYSAIRFLQEENSNLRM